MDGRTDGRTDRQKGFELQYRTLLYAVWFWLHWLLIIIIKSKTQQHQFIVLIY